MWTNYFQRTFLINLTKRPDRLAYASHELRRYFIPYQLFIGVLREDGREGIYESLMAIFRYCVANNIERILVFEDDVKLLLEPKEFNEVMERIIWQLKKIDWWMFKLGGVILQPFEKFASDNILHLRKSYGLHACAYDIRAMKFLLELQKELPFDMAISNTLEPFGNCYCSYPLLATQKLGGSDIEKKVTNWDYHIQFTYKSHIHKLLKEKQEA